MICLVIREIVYVANVGDSRAVLYRDEGGIVAAPLSEDHKPSLE